MSIWRRVGHHTRAVLERAIGTVSWTAMRLLARDVSDEIATWRLLVLAPHPDDETIACGGCIARVVRSGEDVFVAVVTDGRFARHDIEASETALIREGELSRAVAALGLSSSQYASLGYEDDSLTAHIDDLAARIADLIRAYRPTVLLSSWAHDTHRDHAALGRATRMATAQADVLLLEYVVWAWSTPLRLARGRLPRTTAIDAEARHGSARFTMGRPVRVRTDEYLSTKTEALSAHRSQLAPSADRLGLPSGHGPLGYRFLRRFLGSSEYFLAHSPRGSARMGGNLPADHVP
jgi:LmbE family N-acetylglucosaminyl deacetylase